MFDITALGEILIDFTPCGKTVGGTRMFAQNAGGAPANMLAAASKYGCKTAFIGKTGKDMFGDYLHDTLINNGICTDYMRTDDIHNTTLAFVNLHDNGDRDFSFYRQFNADVFLTPEETDINAVINSRVFHFGSLSLTSSPAKEATDKAISAAKNNNVIISYDPNYRPLLWENEATAVATMTEYAKKADITKMSYEEAMLITKSGNISSAAEILHSWGIKTVIITLGADGAYLSTPGFSYKADAFPANTTDTTGAGDIFFGTFLGVLLKSTGNILKCEKELLLNALEKAVKCAALSTEKSGAIPSIPEAGSY